MKITFGNPEFVGNQTAIELDTVPRVGDWIGFNNRERLKVSRVVFEPEEEGSEKYHAVIFFDITDAGIPG